MKKRIILVLLILVISLVGCGSNNSKYYVEPEGRYSSIKLRGIDDKDLCRNLGWFWESYVEWYNSVHFGKKSESEVSVTKFYEGDFNKRISDIEEWLQKRKDFHDYPYYYFPGLYPAIDAYNAVTIAFNGKTSGKVLLSDEDWSRIHDKIVTGLNYYYNDDRIPLFQSEYYIEPLKDYTITASRCNSLSVDKKKTIKNLLEGCIRWYNLMNFNDNEDQYLTAYVYATSGFLGEWQEIRKMELTPKEEALVKPANQMLKTFVDQIFVRGEEEDVYDTTDQLTKRYITITRNQRQDLCDRIKYALQFYYSDEDISLEVFDEINEETETEITETDMISKTDDSIGNYTAVLGTSLQGNDLTVSEEFLDGINSVYLMGRTGTVSHEVNESKKVISVMNWKSNESGLTQHDFLGFVELLNKYFNMVAAFGSYENVTDEAYFWMDNKTQSVVFSYFENGSIIVSWRYKLEGSSSPSSESRSASTTSQIENKPTDQTNNKGIPSSKSEQSKTHFTNGYGTPTTKCAHPGCNEYIAPSGNTNCCINHSNRCLECGQYCDEDAMYCLDCIEKAGNALKK